MLHIIWMGLRSGVGREEAHGDPGLRDQRDGLLILVGSEVVHDDDVARAQGRHQDGAHIRLEHGRVCGPFDDHADGAPVEPHGADHRRRAPMALGRLGP